MANDAEPKMPIAGKNYVLPDKRLSLAGCDGGTLDGITPPVKPLCPHCNSNSGLHRFRSGPKSGTTLCGCFACGKEWPAEDIPISTP